MRIKLSKSDWKSIGQKMGWLKKAQWSGRSDEGPPDPEEGEKLKNQNVEVEFEEIDLPEFPGAFFSGTYVINYDYEFPVHEDGDDYIYLKDIVVQDVHCAHLDPGVQCPLENSMNEIMAGIRRELLDPKNGFPHDDEIREDARQNDPRPYYDPDIERKERYLD